MINVNLPLQVSKQVPLGYFLGQLNYIYQNGSETDTHCLQE